MEKANNSFWKGTFGIIVKIISGIIIAVIGGTGVWYFTKSDGPLNPKEEPKARVEIVDFQVDKVFVGEPVIGHFTVYNEGAASAHNCNLRWNSGDAASGGTVFDLAPDEKKSFTIELACYLREGHYSSSASVSCWYGVPESKVVIRDIYVYRR